MRNLFLSLLLFIPLLSFGQGPGFSQSHSTPLYYNMGGTGSTGGSRTTIATRLQWLKLNGGYKTLYFAYDHYSNHLRGGLGAQYFSMDEMNGEMLTQAASISYSPSINIGRKSDSVSSLIIKPAAHFSIIYQKLGEYSFGDMIDPVYGYIYSTNEVDNMTSSNSIDWGTGLMFYGADFYGGYYVHHIWQPMIGFLYAGNQLRFRHVLQAGYKFREIKGLKSIEVIPVFLLENQAGFTRTEVGVLVERKWLRIGITERFSRALVFQALFFLGDLQMGYSYDLATNRSVRIAGGSTHEITATGLIPKKKEKRKIMPLDF